MTYNGHRNWNQWNVSLWIGNDEPLYRLAMDCLANAKTVDKAARRFKRCLPERTPDGARYSLVAIREALKGLQS